RAFPCKVCLPASEPRCTALPEHLAQCRSRDHGRALLLYGGCESLLAFGESSHLNPRNVRPCSLPQERAMQCERQHSLVDCRRTCSHDPPADTHPGSLSTPVQRKRDKTRQPEPSRQSAGQARHLRACKRIVCRCGPARIESRPPSAAHNSRGIFPQLL